MQRLTRPVRRSGTMALGAAMLFSAHTPLPSNDLTTSFDIAGITARLARGPVSAADAFREVRLEVDGGESGQMLVLFAAVIRAGGVVAVQESRPFRVQPGQPVYDVPLFPEGWQKNGYLPGPYYFPGGTLLPGDMFLPGDRFLFADRFADAMRTGQSSARLERDAGVNLRGADALVLGLVPADASIRTTTAVGLLFIAAGEGFGR